MTGQRQRIEPTDDWQQFDLLVRFPEQRTYQLIRPVVLFGYSPAEPARFTGTPRGQGIDLLLLVVDQTTATSSLPPRSY